MQILRFVGLALVAVGLAMVDPAAVMAQGTPGRLTPEQTIDAIRARPDYQQRSAAEASRILKQQPGGCAMPVVRPAGRALGEVLPPAQAGGQPRLAWLEGYRVENCGRWTMQAVRYILDPPNISAAAMPRGDTRVNIKLYLDVGEPLQVAAASRLAGCAERPWITDIRQLSREPVSGRPWAEIWTWTGCGRTTELTVDFTPTATGTSWAVRGGPRTPPAR
jgi:hypothetical protein